MTTARLRRGPYRQSEVLLPAPARRTRWSLVVIGVILAPLLVGIARRVPARHTRLEGTTRAAAPYHMLHIPDDAVQPLRDVVGFAPTREGLVLVRADGDAFLVADDDVSARVVARRVEAPPWHSNARAIVGLHYRYARYEGIASACLRLDPRTLECEAGRRTPWSAPVVVDGVTLEGDAALRCERLDDGTARCLGDHPATGRIRRRARPQPIAFDVRFTTLAMFENDTCGITTDGAVVCWGPSLHVVRGVRDARSLALRSGLGCAVVADGSVTCWPMPVWPQRVASLEASPVDLPRAVVSIAATSTATCALDALGVVRCWGTFGRAWPGHPGAYRATRPLDVALPTPTTALVPTDDDVMCARDTRGTTHCWGGVPDGWSRERADDTLGDSAPDALWERDVTESARDFRRLGDGRVVMFNPAAPRRWSVLGDLPRARMLVAVAYDTRADVGPPVEAHACALAMNGVAWCWGDNREGQLGLDDAPDERAWNVVHISSADSTRAR